MPVTIAASAIDTLRGETVEAVVGGGGAAGLFMVPREERSGSGRGVVVGVHGRGQRRLGNDPGRVLTCSVIANPTECSTLRPR